jgi:hypothetical protein
MVSVNAAPPLVAEAGLRLMSVGCAANAAGVHATARVAGKITLNHRMNLRALRIWNFLRGVKRSLATTNQMARAGRNSVCRGHLGSCIGMSRLD